MHIPLGAEVQRLKSAVTQWKTDSIRYEGKGWNPATANKGGLAIMGIAYKFLNTSYLWGGKSIFGTDCSGYTQTVYKFFHIPLKRGCLDAGRPGSRRSFIKRIVCGDLAFFENENGKITHVGILLNDKEIIHASGKVRIDIIDDGGIIHVQNRERTHRLKSIRRFF